VSSLYFQDANGPSAESILSFSDGVLVLILPIALGVLFYIVSFIINSPSFRLLTEHQALEFT